MSDDLRDLYQDIILDHGKHPRHFHSLDGSNHEAAGHNPLCGDKLVIYLNVDDKKIIQEVSFQGSGCAISMASASMMTEILKGKSIDTAKHIFSCFHALCTDQEPDTSDIDEDVLDLLNALAGVRHYPIRVKCATLAWHTLQTALEGGLTTTTE